MTPRLSIDDVLAALPPATSELLEAMIASAQREKVGLHLVGGPVRDLLLDRPIVDVDLVVEGDARSVAVGGAPEGARLRRHERFGTVTVETPEASVDLASARRESYRHPGALPKVEPGTLLEDLARRDFSVNALALALTGPPGRSGDTDAGPKAGELIDPVGGLSDLDARRLRVLHDHSFHDDPTRALRAARLAPRLGFALARATRAALRAALRDGAFGAVSGDRLRRELERLFADARRGLDPALALRRLDEWHVLPALEPGLALPAEAVPEIRRLGRSLASPPWRGPRVRPFVPGLAIWLAPLDAALRRRVLARLGVRGELASRIAGFPEASRAWLRPLARARGRGAVDALLQGIDEERLYALHAVAPTPVRRRVVRWAAEDRGRRPSVTGDDLVGLGLQGPAVGRALARIRAAYLDREVANREEALALARELARRSKGRRARRKGS